MRASLFDSIFGQRGESSVVHVGRCHAKRAAALRRNTHEALHSLEVVDGDIRKGDVAFGSFADR